MKPHLDPCPFCGSEADFWFHNAGGDDEYEALIIDCKKCSANMERWVAKYSKTFAEDVTKTKAEMIEEWNTRTERTAKAITEDRVSICDNCSGLLYGYMSYCPCCGAKLDWGEK